MNALTIFVAVALTALVIVIVSLAWRDHHDRRISRRADFSGGATYEEQQATSQAATQAIDSLHGETWAG